MCVVTKIAEPGFQGRGVVFLGSDAVGDDAGFAGDGSPLAGTVEECDVDSVVGGDIVSLARFGVGMEYEVDATRFLQEFIVSGGVKGLRQQGGRTLAARAMHLETRRLEFLVWVVIMPNLRVEVKLERSSIFSESEGSSLFFAV